MKKAFLASAICMVLCLFLTSNVEAARHAKSAINKHIKNNKKTFGTPVVHDIWIYTNCADGSKEATGLIETITTTNGGVTTTITTVTTRPASQACLNPWA